MLATLNNAWRRSASGAMAVSTKATTLRPAATSTIAMVARRHQSSSSSSPSSSSDMMPLDFASLVTSGERPIQASSMDRIDLAHGSFFALHRPLLGLTNKSVEVVVARQGHEGKFLEGSVLFCAVEDMTHYFSTLRAYNPPSTPSTYNHMDSQKIVQDFFRQIENKAMIMSTIDGQAPTTPIQSIMDELDDTNVMHMTSVLRKRRIKMRKHKYKKLRKRTRALRKKLGK
ncbi:hypothetical protein BG015_006854 [Linnemannia schmuckeri]|uniref:Small ribosomal subunit protein mS38 n=1 Tax=Linnemannia schmuckeri TaxID=64567 RepID=A0A9P5VB93_9FUNG|nr:hypothetical protein BG015_006854 [Linnemannia schmuckeri]